MNLKLLKDYINSDLSLKSYCSFNNLKYDVTNRIVINTAHKLRSCTFIKSSSFLGNSCGARDVRNNKNEYLKAIDEYEMAIKPFKNEETDNRKISDLTVSDFIALMKSL